MHARVRGWPAWRVRCRPRNAALPAGAAIWKVRGSAALGARPGRSWQHGCVCASGRTCCRNARARRKAAASALTPAGGRWGPGPSRRAARAIEHARWPPCRSLRRWHAAIKPDPAGAGRLQASSPRAGAGSKECVLQQTKLRGCRGWCGGSWELPRSANPVVDPRRHPPCTPETRSACPGTHLHAAWPVNGDQLSRNSQMCTAHRISGVQICLLVFCCSFWGGVSGMRPPSGARLRPKSARSARPLPAAGQDCGGGWVSTMARDRPKVGRAADLRGARAMQAQCTARGRSSQLLRACAARSCCGLGTASPSLATTSPSQGEWLASCGRRSCCAGACHRPAGQRGPGGGSTQDPPRRSLQGRAGRRPLDPARPPAGGSTAWPGSTRGAPTW
jgi:hypothetical protein